MSDHFFRPHPLLELLFGKKLERKGRFLESRSFGVGFFGDLGGIFVAKARVEGSDKHEGILKVSLNALMIRFNPSRAMLVE